MSKSKSILTPFEVRKYSPAGAHYPLDNIRLMMDIIEYDFFSKCLGLDIYEAMKKDFRVWDQATLWDSEITYKSGDFTIYDGAVLESEASNNTTEPGPDNEKWKEAAKFKKKNFNALWEYHLQRILAFDIYKRTLTYDTIKSGAKGLNVSAADQSGAMTAPVKDIEYTKSSIQRDIDTMVGSMKKWIVDQHELFTDDATKGYDFSLVGFISEDCNPCIVPGPINRRFGFKK